MSIQRWDPWRDMLSLREAMNHLLDDPFGWPRTDRSEAPTGIAVDLRETDDAYVVETVLPGATSDDVHISVLGDRLTISAEISESEEQKEARWLVRERRYGSFERSITLPGHVRADDASADFRDGILTVTLPKAEESRARQIPVNTSALPEESSNE